jgi:D-alanine-D-alanine ligase
MKVAVLFDGISALGKTPDLAILETVEAVEAALATDSHEAVRVPVNPDGRWIERMRKGHYDLAFNLCEGIDGIAYLEPPVIAALELLEIPYTGSSSWTTSLCLRKHLVNTVLGAEGLPVPRWLLGRPGMPVPSVGYPAICKPAAEDSSLGVEQRSVVRTAKALERRLNDMFEEWDEVVVQRYVDGREVNVGIVGDAVLPIAEIDFAAMPAGFWRIVSYRSKWETGCEEDLGATPRCPADLSDALTATICDIARAAWRAVGGEGYGRVDMRVDRSGRPWILEVNSNPDIAPNAGLARMAQAAGLDYAALIREVAHAALSRTRVPTAERWPRKYRLSGVVPDVVPAEPAPRAARRASGAEG